MRATCCAKYRGRLRADRPAIEIVITGFVTNGATVYDLAGNRADLSNVTDAFNALSINETIVPACTIGGLTRPALELNAAGDIILTSAASAFAATYGIKSLYLGLPASTPYPPVADPHMLPFHSADGFHLV